jgi:hypothetical protein
MPRSVKRKKCFSRNINQKRRTKALSRQQAPSLLQPPASSRFLNTALSSRRLYNHQPLRYPRSLLNDQPLLRLLSHPFAFLLPCTFPLPSPLVLLHTRSPLPIRLVSFSHAGPVATEHEATSSLVSVILSQPARFLDLPYPFLETIPFYLLFLSG